MNDTLEGISSRITEGGEQASDLEGQTGGNHCRKTEYRKKNENK